jgi:hypothetical protein
VLAPKFAGLVKSGHRKPNQSVCFGAFKELAPHSLSEPKNRPSKMVLTCPLTSHGGTRGSRVTLNQSFAIPSTENAPLAPTVRRTVSQSPSRNADRDISTPALPPRFPASSGLGLRSLSIPPRMATFERPDRATAQSTRAVLTVSIHFREWLTRVLMLLLPRFLSFHRAHLAQSTNFFFLRYMEAANTPGWAPDV